MLPCFGTVVLFCSRFHHFLRILRMEKMACDFVCSLNENFRLLFLAELCTPAAPGSEIATLRQFCRIRHQSRNRRQP